ncbi:restriction endonuclease [uncultured Nostoc sp.]|uniref:restriction endonuclease n=1 Tax=uncultured Nostoc sp. TaxID=340711 RepID=UPI0035CCAA09
MSQLDKVLRQFEATEANLVKLEKLWDLLQKNIPDGIVFSTSPVYEDALRLYELILAELPLIDGTKPRTLPCDLDEIAKARCHVLQVGELEIQIELNRRIEQPSKELREYKFRFNQKRRKLIQNKIMQISNEIDQVLEKLQQRYSIDYEDRIDYGKNKIEDLAAISNNIKQIDILLGNSVRRPTAWIDMKRHLSYAQIDDLRDIILFDWPSVKAGITESLYTANYPIPVDIQDLGELVASIPSGNIITKLNWERLSAEDFERLIFNLITLEQSYENPEWLMHINAPDRGRDLSVYRVHRDLLSGVIRRRIIIQCKHWLTKSISVPDLSAVKDQVKLWEPSRMDILVIATTGRFTPDAVHYVEKHNQSDSAMTIELWPESHLETVLASNPHLVAEFGLR